MSVGDREATARRVRAARIVAGLTVEELAAKLGGRGLGTRTIGKIERVERDAEPHELQRIAEVTDVPLWFLRHGFDGQAIEDEAEPTLGERLDALQGEVEALRGQHSELREMRERLGTVEADLSAVRRLAASWPTAAPPGVQPPGQQASRTSESTPRRSRRRPVGAPPQEDER